jgi:putative membrane protein
MAPELLIGTFIGRWYVTLFALAYLVYGTRLLGARRLAIYSAIAFVVAAASENASVVWGVPYTLYSFNQELRAHELFIGNVPLMVPLSYTFVMFFSFSAARYVTAGPWRTAPASGRAAYLLAVVFATWSTWTLDPISQRGARWYLGDLFHYAGPGFWFDLPLLSQVGWCVVSATLCGLLAWMTPSQVPQPVARAAQHPLLPCFITFLVQILHLAVVALFIGETTLGGAGFIIWIPAFAVAAALWVELHAAARSRASAELPGASASRSGRQRDAA